MRYQDARVNHSRADVSTVSSSLLGGGEQILYRILFAAMGISDLQGLFQRVSFSLVSLRAVGFVVHSLAFVNLCADTHIGGSPRSGSLYSRLGLLGVNRQAADDWVTLPVDPSAGERSRKVPFSPTALEDIKRVEQLLAQEQGDSREVNRTCSARS